MKSIYIFCSFLIIASLSSCNKSNNRPYGNSDIIENNIFENKELGWKMRIPTNWKVTSKEEANKRVLEGYETIESSTGEDYDKSQFSNILAFEKDMFNTFSSTIEKYDTELHGDWKETNSKLKKVIYESYISQGIKVDSTATKTEIIDGVEFEYSEYTLYNENNQIAIRQIMYSQYLNGFDFGVNINFNNGSDRDLLLKHWRNSKFTKN